MARRSRTITNATATITTTTTTATNNDDDSEKNISSSPTAVIAAPATRIPRPTIVRGKAKPFEFDVK